MTHAWCHDIARDAAVRAAEDNRTGPLPTLAEAIAAVRERRSEQTKGDEMSHGLRTERVTLEVTHGESFGVSHWSWVTILRLQSGESVRVVDGDITDNEIALTVERDAAIRERDALQARIAELEAQIGQADAEDAAVGYALRLFVDGRRVLSHELGPTQAGAFLIAADHLAKYIREEYKPITDATNARVAELEAASGGNRPETPDRSSHAASGGGGSDARTREISDGILALEHMLHLFRDDQRPTVQARLEKMRRLVEVLRDHPQAASGGGEGEPVAWMCEWTDHVGLHHAKADAEDEAAGDIVPQPLYRQPPQPRGWLTGEERALIAGITDDDEYTEEGQDIAKGLLARSSPPLVVLPENPYHPSGLREGFEHALRSVRNELVNAGVPVKEVGQ
jgi:hypothetical protein